MTNLTVTNGSTKIYIRNRDGTSTPLEIEGFDLSMTAKVMGVSTTKIINDLDSIVTCMDITIPKQGKLNPDLLKLKTIRTATATYRNLTWPWRLDADASEYK